jgi:hypothetical protein
MMHGRDVRHQEASSHAYITPKVELFPLLPDCSCTQLPRTSTKSYQTSEIRRASTDLSLQHSIMLAVSALVTLLSAVSTTMSAPVDNPAISADPYNCGYVRTRPNSSAVAGIFAYDSCMPFFYNETIRDYEKAFAYTLYGGCTCRFYR